MDLVGASRACSVLLVLFVVLDSLRDSLLVNVTSFGWFTNTSELGSVGVLRALTVFLILHMSLDFLLGFLLGNVTSFRLFINISILGSVGVLRVCTATLVSVLFELEAMLALEFVSSAFDGTFSCTTELPGLTLTLLTLTFEGIRTRDLLICDCVRAPVEADVVFGGGGLATACAAAVASVSSDQMRSMRLRGGERAFLVARRRGARGVSYSCVVDVVTRLRVLPKDGSFPIVSWN